MIRVNSQGARALGTGKNVSGAASTFVSEGPKDKLAAVDAYQGPLPSDAPYNPSSGECRDCTATEEASSGRVGGGNENVTSDGITSRLNASGGTSDRVTATLWEALLCGSLDPNAESGGVRRSRMGRTALWMRSTGCGAEDLVDLLAVRGGRAGIDRVELKRRMDAALDNSIAVLDEEERDNLIDMLAETTGSDADVIRASMNAGESVTEISGVRQTEVRSFSEFVSQYTGVPELIQVFDLGAETAILDSLLSKSIDLGLPQAWQAIIDQIDDDKIKTTRALRSLRQAAILSDLTTVRSIVDRAGASRSLAEVPELVPLINRFYTWGSKTPTSEYGKKRDELISTLDSINPNWARKRRGDDWVDDLEPFNSASGQALTLLKQSDYAVQAMIAQPYPKSNYQTVARKYNPWAIDFSTTA